MSAAAETILTTGERITATPNRIDETGRAAISIMMRVAMLKYGLDEFQIEVTGKRGANGCIKVDIEEF